MIRPIYFLTRYCALKATGRFKKEGYSIYIYKSPRGFIVKLNNQFILTEQDYPLQHRDFI
jgi:hypothetical protein